MATYLVGDIQGCDAALGQLLHTLDFSPSRDVLLALGDLVNRGPDSLAVLRRLQALGGAAQCILGNHDLHCLAVASGVRRMGNNDTLAALLAAPDAPALLQWLRQRPLALQREGVLMVHAGVLPGWTAIETIAYAHEVADQLQQPNYAQFLAAMYGNAPDQWDVGLQGHDRLRVIVNALTRLRFCSADGRMEFASKEGAGAAPKGCMPWFDVPGRKTAGSPVAFGHWSTLGLRNSPDLLGLDTGCVWGGCLSAMRIDGGRRDLVQIDCVQSQAPGRKLGQTAGQS